jgi:hypothetical protein
MLRNAVGKVLWMGRATSTIVGLALMLALAIGAASAALGADGDFFKLGRNNLADSVSRLTKSGTGPALDLRVNSGPPLAVNRQAKVDNLNADKLDGKDARALMPAQTYVVEETIEMSSNTAGTVRVVFCDDGDAAISGGFSGLGPETDVTSSYRKTYVGSLTWWVAVRKSVGAEDTWIAQAVCADFPPLKP